MENNNLPVWYGKKTFTIKTPFLFQGCMMHAGQRFDCSREDWIKYRYNFVEQEASQAETLKVETMVEKKETEESKRKEMVEEKPKTLNTKKTGRKAKK
jgi:hypothetical protein